MCVCVLLNHFAVQQKLTHCKYFNKVKIKNKKKSINNKVPLYIAQGTIFNTL